MKTTLLIVPLILMVLGISTFLSTVEARGIVLKEDFNNPITVTIHSETREGVEIPAYHVDEYGVRRELAFYTHEGAGSIRMREEQARITETREGLTRRNEDFLRTLFPEYKEYTDGTYSLNLPFTGFEIQTVHMGYYEVIDEIVVPFTGFSENDLYDIAKERVFNGIEYVLIRVDWEKYEYNYIDGSRVADTFQGIAIYQAVLTRRNADTFNVTAIYEGNPTRQEVTYYFSAVYQEVEEIVEEDEGMNVVAVAIISALGLVLAGLLVWFLAKGKKQNEEINKTN
jgi:hypothetical protein